MPRTALSRRLAAQLARFARQENGAIAAMGAVALTVLLGFGAFAIDMSYAYSERNRLQVTASAAARNAYPCFTTRFTASYLNSSEKTRRTRFDFFDILCS